MIPAREVIKEEMDCVKGSPPSAFCKPCVAVVERVSLFFWLQERVSLLMGIVK